MIFNLTQIENDIGVVERMRPESMDAGCQIRDGDVVHIRHVEAPVPLRGTGAADRLMVGIAAKARAENLKLLPLCGYARAWLRRHREYADLLT